MSEDKYNFQVIESHPERRSADLVATPNGNMSRKQAEALADNKPEPAKTGAARIQELQRLKTAGKITDRMLAELTVKAMRGEDTSFTTSQVQESKDNERQLIGFHEYKQADDSLVDLTASIEQRATNGERINPDIGRELDDRFRQLVGVANRQGYTIANTPRLQVLQEHVDNVKKRVLEANAMRKLAK